MITINDLAKELSISASGLRKTLHCRHITVLSQRINNRRRILLSDEDAITVRAWYGSERKIVPPPSINGTAPPSAMVVYVIQTAPDIKPERIKVGVSDALAARIADFKAICPTLLLRRTYLATFSHESVIHQMLANAFTRVSEEVFDVSHIENGLKHIDGFFAFLGIEPTFKA